MVRKAVVVLAAALLATTAGPTWANTIASSTIWFQGTLTDGGDGTYTGSIDAVAGTYYVPGGAGTHFDGTWKTPDGNAAAGGFDVYAQTGGTVYVEGMSPDTWTVADHDAYAAGGPWGTWYDPDVPDYQNYHLELTATTWRVWAFLDRTSPYNETPLSGPMDWDTMLAYEDGANWNPIWTWGEEDIPLQYGGFSVKIQQVSGGEYLVSLTPCPTSYKAEFTSEDYNLDGRFTMPAGYASIFAGGASSGGIDGDYDFGLSTGPDYTGWNSLHTGEGNYDDPSWGWYYEFNNGGYTDAYSSTEATDSGYKEFEWTFENVIPSANGYYLTVSVNDLDDYAFKKGIDWISVPDLWQVYVNGSYVGDLYAYDDPYNPGGLSVNTFYAGAVDGSVKVEIDGAYFDLLHDNAYYGSSYGYFPSWGDTASAQHGVRLEALELDSAVNILYLEPTAESLYVRNGETVTVDLKQADLVTPVAGYQAFVEFDTSLLTFASGSYTNSPYGWHVLTIDDSGTDIDLAAGIDPEESQSPTTADATLAGLVFTAGATEGITQIEFRSSVYESRFTDDEGYEVEATTINSQNIVIDNTAPVIACPGDVVSANDPDVCSASLDPGTATAVDILAGVESVVGTRSDALDLITDPYPEGTTTITWVATDKAGNTSSCLQTITVNDTEDPSITCPGDKTVDTDLDVCTAVVNGIDPVFSDNCPGATVAYVLTGATTGSGAGSASGLTFNKGVTTVEYTVTDASSNTASCSFTVTVEDNQNPSITCPGDKTVDTDTDVCTAVVNGIDPVFSDNCPGATVAYVLTGATTGSGAGSASGLTFNKGVTTVEYTVTDASSNTASCSFTVTVVDNQNPTITAPADIVQDTDGGVCYATITDLGTPVFDDNCPGATVDNDAPANDEYAKGITVVTWTVTDASGNTATAAQNVTVNDAEAPVVTKGTIDACYATVSAAETAAIAATTATDNCTASGSLVFTASTAGTCSATVTVTVKDEANNSASVDYNTKIDGEAPVVTCPANITVSADAGSAGAVVTWPAPAVTDNCDTGLTATCVPASGSTFAVGTTTVTCTATDSCGNVGQCTFDVTVLNKNEAAITVEFENITVGADRYLEFQFGGDGTGANTYTTTKTVTFTSGTVVVDVDVEPAGVAWTCVSVKDLQHSLRSQVPLSIVGTEYSASVTGADKLIGGDLTNDNLVDILDFGAFVGQYGTKYGGYRAWPARDADISGDGSVGTADFSYIQSHFLTFGDDICAGAAVSSEPRSSVIVYELASYMGYSTALAADLNGDRWVDEKDVKLFVKTYLSPKRSR